MGPEDVIFVGGPLDGEVRTYFEGMGAIKLPISVNDGPAVHHLYWQADLLDPPEQGFNEEGQRRYIYIGESAES